MSRFLAKPVTNSFAQRPIRRRHRGVTCCMVADLHPMQIPDNALADANNVDLFPFGIRSRSGTKLFGTLPKLATGVSASKSGSVITIAGGYTATDACLGGYFVWPDGTNELILSRSGQALTVHSDTAHFPVVSTASIRQELNGHIWQSVARKHVALVGDTLYYAAWNMSEWTKALCVSRTGLANSKSTIRQYGDNVYIWNANGKFLLDLGSDYPVVRKVNNESQECSLTFKGNLDSNMVVIDHPRNNTLNSGNYKRRYTVTMVERQGNFLDSAYDAFEPLVESAPFAVDSDGKDYYETETLFPVGPSASEPGAIVYSELVGGYITTTVEAFAAYSDAQVNFTVNSATENITVDFAGVKNYREIAERIEDQLQAIWPQSNFVYIGGGQRRFAFYIYEPGFTIGYCTAGAGGTDVSGMIMMRTSDYGTLLAEKGATRNNIIGNLKVPLYESNVAMSEYTHYRVYATKNVGYRGIDAQTGIGNNSELYIHVEDVPILKPLILTVTQEEGEPCVATITKGRITLSDVGSTIVLSSGVQLVIGAYVSETEFTSVFAPVGENMPGVIGIIVTSSAAPFAFSQSGHVVTAEGGATPFTESDVGNRLFASDGSVLLVTEYVSSGSVNVADSTTRTQVGGVRLPPFNELYRRFSDTITDDVLSTRISKIWCKNRFWEPIPNCELGVDIPGFFISAVKGGGAIYQTQLADLRFAGYYDPLFQIDSVQDDIQALRAYKGILAAMCSGSIVVWDTSITAQDTRPEVGALTAFLAQKKALDQKVGVKYADSIASVEEGVDVFVTNHGEVRTFDGNSFSTNIIENKMMALTRKIQAIGAASYDSIGGYLVWGTEGETTTVLGIERLPFPEVCYRFALNGGQGAIGGTRVTGAAWVRPPNGAGGITVFDPNGKPWQIVLDNASGDFYWISTYDGPEGSGLAKTWLDKDDGEGGGEQIEWSVKYGADSGEHSHFKLRHEVSNLVLVPENPSKSGEDDYDEDGFRNGFEVSFEQYAHPDYEESVAKASKVNHDGDISYDASPYARGIQHKISGNRSEAVIVELTNYYTRQDMAETPDKRTSSESDYQKVLSAPVLWLTRNAKLYRNMATGKVVNSASPTSVEGPDGRANSGFQISGATEFGSANVALGTVFFWHQGLIWFAIGGTTVSVTEVGTIGTWSLKYATNINLNGVVRFTPVSTAKVFDFRLYSGAFSLVVSGVTVSEIAEYLYKDMVNNQGSNTLPIW